MQQKVWATNGRPYNRNQIKSGVQKAHRFVFLVATESVSRVLYLTTIYLGHTSPYGSSHLRTVGQTMRPYRCCSGQGLQRSYVTVKPGELLPRLSTLTFARRAKAVYLCCTLPEVAFGCRQQLSSPCGARTFLETFVSLSSDSLAECIVP